MINRKETVIVNKKRKINDSETVIVKTENNSKESERHFISLENGSFINEYKVISNLSGTTRARIYKVLKDDCVYIAKVYERNWQPVRKLRMFFLNSNHDNIMKMIDSGRLFGMYYEIYPYYPNGSIEEYVKENGAFSIDYLKKYIVPALNEGLFFLHSNGIIHCDIKPSNLYIDFCGNEPKIIIGDFGSCQVVDSDGKARGVLEGTIDFMVPLQDFGGVKIIPVEYDFVSLGLSLYWMSTLTELMNGLEIDEMARVWDRNITIPVKDSSFRNLLEGLINKDLSKVWKYNEIKNWCENGWNSGVKRRIVRHKVQEYISLDFGIIDGDILTVNTIHKLVVACKKYWSFGKNVIQRQDTADFIRQFDYQLYDMVNSEKNEKNKNDDVLLFRILYQLERTNEICYKGCILGNLIEFVEKLKNQDPIAIDFVLDGVLSYYLDIMGADKKDVQKLNDIIDLNTSNVLDKYGTINTICRAFMKNRIINLEGYSIDCIGSFVDFISMKRSSEIIQIIENEDVIEWLVTMGFVDEVKELKSIRS